MTKTVNIMDLMNVNFYSLWLADESHIVAKGGRSSMKSSVISMKLVTDFLEDDQGNVVCLRKVGKYLSTSIYEQIKWAIYMLGVESEFYFGKSPLIIRHKQTNTAFYFYGCDDPLKLKSAKIAKGYVMALWYEEAAEFAGVEDIDIVEDTFIRQQIEGKEVKVYFSYNPPRNPYSWINEWLDSKANDEDYFIHHSTYMDDKKGFLSQQMIRKIEKYKVHDLDYWRWMYGGEVIGLGDMVYNMNHIQLIDELPNDDDIILIDTASDTGHQVSATTHLAIGFTKKRNVILLDTYYYSPANKVVKKAPSELSKDLKEWMDSTVKVYNRFFDKQTIDSAEGALRNQFFKDYGIRLHPVAKKKKIDMIDNVQDLMAQGRFFVLNTPANQIFIEEHRKYQWDANTLQSDDPKVIKEDDHTVDSFQYYVQDNLQKLGLKY
ncbi:PBSX family phage terminase large subunit [Bacillus sp. AFS098217]|uniref:PBSX family phage terminase large subunit n=1 Tax=unclassified Bacillus (in: firmicutes) TaxID=185979 RepID=UPI000BEBE873|nr:MULTISPECIES: PBSX family phage terminase large subunit [unclassified Bacillus (in: firmicutes)]PEB52455.1 PBSX family phage terminase large subunit [Bacillus sp. AFS098217]PEU16821.1 PBSX family phage terminase large subunit [Bacillus sp. AFS019443]PEU20350.1 PBSX family phage terminase large subunit [Bacillus sp. AFS014408]